MAIKEEQRKKERRRKEGVLKISKKCSFVGQYFFTSFLLEQGNFSNIMGYSAFMIC